MKNNVLIILIAAVIVILGISLLYTKIQKQQYDDGKVVDQQPNIDIDDNDIEPINDNNSVPDRLNDTNSPISESGRYKYSIGGRDYQGRVTVEHEFKSGEHFIAGTIETPTACYKVSVADVIVQESYPEMVTIDLAVRPLNTFAPCIQVITYQDFETNLSVSKNAVIYLSVNDKRLDFRIN